MTYEELRAWLSQVSNDVDTASGKVLLVEDTVTASEAQLAQLEREVAALGEAVGTLGTKIEDLGTELDLIGKSIKKLQAVSTYWAFSGSKAD